MRSASERATRYRRTLAAALGISWLLAMAYAFWWFQLRNLQPFETASRDRTVLFEAGRMAATLSVLLNTRSPAAAPAGAPIATLVHFWDPSCPCSRFNEQHVRDIIAAYRQHDVRFLVVARSSLSDDALDELARKTFGNDVRLVRDSSATMELTPSSPATAILDAHGELAYFGPYSVGALCTTSNGKFAENVLDQLINGSNPQQWNTWASGCFCNWRSQV